MITEDIREPQMGLTFEKVWAMFQETDRKMRETDRILQETIAQMRETDRIVRETDRQMQETDRQIKEMTKETDRQMRETDRQIKEMTKETDRQMRETDRKIGKLGDRLGDLVEHIIAPNLLEKFNKLGFSFGKIGSNVCYKRPNGEFIAEVDILLENGDTVLAVEVKSKLSVSDVREHTERMKKLRAYADEHGDARCFIGAAAGAIIPEGVKPFAYKSGFYVIEQSGDTIKIEAPQGFVPRKW
ncbi:MAG: hypothetical protein LBC27_05930 [Spirochaetaceae bacterium]|jgi:hypothetical protein|nr:hypothetical protein [Spirochaetaceae bacterium]